MVVRNVEIIMYYRPLCPVCPRLREVVEEVLVETGLYRKIPFTEQIIAPPFIYDNPFARIAKEEKITVVNIGRGRAERIPVRDVADYAHLHVETPILEVRVYQDTSKRGLWASSRLTSHRSWRSLLEALGWNIKTYK